MILKLSETPKFDNIFLDQSFLGALINASRLIFWQHFIHNHCRQVFIIPLGLVTLQTQLHFAIDHYLLLPVSLSVQIEIYFVASLEYEVRILLVSVAIVFWGFQVQRKLLTCYQSICLIQICQLIVGNHNFHFFETMHFSYIWRIKKNSQMKAVEKLSFLSQ